MQGFAVNPPSVGRIPRVYWVAATYAHVAVPVNRGLRAWPNLGSAGPFTNWQ